MARGVLLPKSTRIRNSRLHALFVTSVFLVMIGVIWNFLASEGGTIKLRNDPQVAVSLGTASIAESFKDKRFLDRQCSSLVANWQKRTNTPKQPSNITKTFKRDICTFLSRTSCDFGVDFDACMDAEEIYAKRSPFDLEVVIKDEFTFIGPNATPMALAPHELQTHETARETRLHVFAQAYTFNFTYRFALETSPPDFWGFNKDILLGGTNREARTVLLDRDGLPAQSFAAGQDIIVGVPQLLQVARQLGRVTAPQASGKFGNFAGDSNSFPSWVWDEGATIFVAVNCYASDWDLQKKAGHAAQPGHDDAVWNLGATAEEPVCLLQAMLASTESSRTRVAEKLPGATIRHNRVSLRVIGKLGNSFFRAREPNAVLLYITSALVLLQLPMKLTRFIALNCLGRLSRVYKSVVVQDFDVVYHCARAIVLLASQSVCFLELADKPGPDGDEYGGISRTRMLERVLAVVRHRASNLDAGEVSAISDFAFKRMRKQSASTSQKLVDWDEEFSTGCNPFRREARKPDSLDDVAEEILDIDHFCRATGSDALSMEDIVALFDRDRRYCPGERFFTPPELWQQVHSGERRRGAARLSRMDELQNGHVPLEHLRASFTKSLSDGTEARQVVTDMLTKLVQVGKELSTCSAEVELLRIHVDELRTELQHERELRQATEDKFAQDLCRHAAELEHAAESRDLSELEQAVRDDMTQMDSDLRLLKGSMRKSDPHSRSNDAETKLLRQEMSKLDIKLAAVKRTSEDTTGLRAELAAGMDRIVRRAQEAAEEKCKLLLQETASAAPKMESGVDELARNAMDELGASHSKLLETVSSHTHRLEMLHARIDFLEGRLNNFPPKRPESPPMTPPVLQIRRRGLEIFDCSPNTRIK